MAKKAKARLETKKTRKKLKTQTQRTMQTFLHGLQQIVKEFCEKSFDSNDSDRVLLRTRDTSRKSSSRRESVFSHTNVRHGNATYDNLRTCYRCQHFLEIPHNLSRPFNRISTFVERCKGELSFVQAIVLLKSAAAFASQIPVGQLQQIFDRQWDTHGEHRKDERTDVELRSPVNKGSLVSEGMSMKDTFATLTPLNISDPCVPCVTPQRTISYIRSKDAWSKLLGSVSANDLTQSSVEFSLEGSRIATRETKRVECSIIPESDVESTQSENFDMFNSLPEHQCFEFEKDKECSVQSASKSGIEQINKKIIESKYTLQKSQADVPSEGKSILPARNQSINSIFCLEKNVDNRDCSMRSQNNLADKVPEFDGTPKSFNITQKDVSQMSNINSDKYFEFLFDDNSPWQVSDTAVGNSCEDSAYSTSSRNDIFNCDIAVETESGNKRSSDTEHYYKLQPCKKKTIMYETRNVSSLTNEMLISDDSSKSLIITQEANSQISNVYDAKNSEFQIISSYDERMSSEDSEDDCPTAAKSISDKYTPNIYHRYELHPCNDKTITCETMAASTSIQEAVIPNTEHHYNLQACGNREINDEKQTPSTTIGGPEEYKSTRTRNLLEKENRNEDEIISTDWWNFTLESLHIERTIIKSIEVILSTLCDKRMVEEYVIKERLRNTRNYWKDSLEEEAVNAVLNISDIFTTEGKPDICIKVIMKAIVRTLNEMMCAQLNKKYCTETSLWIYRVQIILEFCNSLPICVKVTDYLITKLKSLQSALTKGKIQKNIMINQLHLVFYALNITLRKYCTILSCDQRFRPVEKVIPHVADLWKMQYIDKELEYTGLDLDAAEKRWLNALENSAVVFTKYFVQFVKKSFSLIHVLISQSSTRIT